MKPFRNLRAQPFFRDQEVTVAWDTPVECLAGNYYVYRSTTGLKGDWELLNEYAPVSHGLSHWVDTAKLPAPGATLYYRLCYVHTDGAAHDSEVVELFSVLPREQYGLVRQIIWEEFTQLKHGGGLRVAHCIPLASGELASHIDPETLQPFAEACSASDSYGQPFVGGFLPPIRAWVKLSQVDIGKEDRQDGAGVDFKYDVILRMCAFPRPAMGHMIVNPRTDDRWVVGGKIKPYMFRGVVPIAWSVPAVRLCDDDPRHGLPIPTEGNDWP